MSGLATLHWVASAVAERLLYSVGEGMALAVIVWVLLRVVPRRNSRTRFAVWFATLVSIAVLPFLSASSVGGPFVSGSSSSHASGSSQHALITVSGTWAVYIFLGWMAIALARLAQVVAGLVQLHTLRASSIALDHRVLGPDAGNLVAECRGVRGSSIMVSRCVDVPTAVGFLSPAIILPVWLAEETDPEELKYIVLHELAHLRRRDDWTNLAQKIVKAALFFHPGIWWIERRLSLDREMACDDAVLAQSGSPKGYAQCLARVAQKSFLRRQIALAQAAVSRVRQLSLRVAQILDVQRPRTTRLWKPAIPMVTVMAVLCAFSTTYLPQLVSFTADAPVGSAPAQLASHASDAMHPASIVNARSGIRAWDVALRSDNHDARATARRPSLAQTRARGALVAVPPHKPASQTPGELRTLATGYGTPEKSEPVIVQEEVLMVLTTFQSTSAGQQSRHVQVFWQLRVVAPTAAVPKVVPRKT
jgi:beta-lactamase regulating signal transducer with metallopeptidase domain